jgi:hypothetical protein
VINADPVAALERAVIDLVRDVSEASASVARAAALLTVVSGVLGIWWLACFQAGVAATCTGIWWMTRKALKSAPPVGRAPTP